MSVMKPTANAESGTSSFTGMCDAEAGQADARFSCCVPQPARGATDFAKAGAILDAARALSGCSCHRCVSSALAVALGLAIADSDSGRQSPTYVKAAVLSQLTATAIWIRSDERESRDGTSPKDGE